jgi:hypothetical protein
MSEKSKKNIENFDIINYFLKGLIMDVNISKILAYYCAFEEEELLLYYPAGIFSEIEKIIPEHNFHPTKRIWYKAIIDNNLNFSN